MKKIFMRLKRNLAVTLSAAMIMTGVYTPAYAEAAPVVEAAASNIGDYAELSLASNTGIEEGGVYTVPYTGSETGVEIKVKKLGSADLLVQDVDYTVSGNATATEPGTYSVYVIGIGEYTGTMRADWKIVKHTHHWVYTADYNTVNVECDEPAAADFCDYHNSALSLKLKVKNSVTYSGQAFEDVQLIASGVSAGTAQEKLDKFNELTVSDNSVEKVYYQTSTGTALAGAPSNVGAYKALLDVGNVTIYTEFSINAENVEVDDTDLFSEGWVYDGTAHSLINASKIAEYAPSKGSFTYLLKKDSGVETGKTLNELKATDAGRYKVSYSFTASGNYAGTQSNWAYVNVSRKSLTNDMVTLSESSYEYDGAPHLPVITVKDGEKTLVKDTDYSVVSAAAKTAIGIYYYSIKGEGNYANTISKKWSISAKDIDPALISVSDNATYTFDGTNKLAAVSVNTIPSAVVKYSSTRLGTYSDYETAKANGVGVRNAGESTVWYQIEADNYKTYTGSYTLKVEPKEISVSWNVVKDSVSSDFSSYVYNGQEQMPYASVIGLEGSDVAFLTVEADNAALAGSHTATVTGITGANAANYKLPVAAQTKAYSIQKADMVIANLPVIKVAIPYSGVAEKVLSAAATVKSLQYAVYGSALSNVDYADANVEYTITPKGIRPALNTQWFNNYSSLTVVNAGEYTVWAKATADANHKVSDMVSGNVIVGRGTFAAEDFTAEDEVLYNGAAQTPELVVDEKYTGLGYNVAYGVSDNGIYNLNYTELKAALNTVTVSDNAVTVYYKVSMDNYNDYEGSYSYKITPATLAFDWVANDGNLSTDTAFVYKYNKAAQGVKAVVTNKVGTDDVYITVSGNKVAASESAYSASIVGIAGTDSKNYVLPSEGLTKEFSIIKADIEVSGLTVKTTLSYNGINQAVVIDSAEAQYVYGAEKEGCNTAILYSFYKVNSDGTLGEALLTDKAAAEMVVKTVGKYKVAARVAGDTNHNAGEQISETIIVNAGKLTITVRPTPLNIDYDGEEYYVATGIDSVKADVEDAIIYFKVTKGTKVLLEKGTKAEVKELSAKAPGEYIVECWAESEDAGYLPSDRVRIVSKINQAEHADVSINDSTAVGTVENNIAIYLGDVPDGMIYGTPSANSIKIGTAEVKNWMNSSYLVIAMNEAAAKDDVYVITVPVVDDPASEDIAGYKDYKVVVTITTKECTHRKISFHKAVEATCTEDGNTEYWECSDCGTLFKSLSPTVLYGGIPYVWATGHTAPENNEITVDVAPTCTAEGKCSIRCTVCGEKLYEDTIDKVPHEFVEKEILIAPTAVTTGMQNYVCKHCGMQEVRELPTVDTEKNSYEELAEAQLKKVSSEGADDNIIAYQTDTDTAALAINYQKGRPKKFLVTALNGSVKEATVTVEAGMKKIYLPGKGYSIVNTTCDRKLKLKERKKDADTALELKKSKTNYEVVATNGEYTYTINVRALSFDKDLRKLVLNSDDPDESEVVCISPLNGEGITGGVWTVGTLLLSKLDTEYYVTSGKAVVKASVNVDGSLLVRPVSGSGKVKIVYSLNGVKYQTSVKVSDRELKDADYDYRAKFGLK